MEATKSHTLVRMGILPPNLWSSCVGVTECGGQCPLVKVSVYTIYVDKGIDGANSNRGIG